MGTLGYLSALNLALREEMAADERVVVFGEDVGAAMTGVTAGLLDAHGRGRVVDMPLSEQGFTSFATGAAMAGKRPVIELQIPSLLFLVFEQIANQAHKFSLMTGGQVNVPVTYLVTGSGSRFGMAGQHSDHPYGIFAHVGVKTVVPGSASDAYGLLRTAVQDPDPVAVFAPSALMGASEEFEGRLAPIPLGSARVRRTGDDVTVVAIGHLVDVALGVAEAMSDEVSIEVVDPRSVHPVDWEALRRSVGKTGRLVVVDDSNRSCGIGGEILATAAEEFDLTAPPKRVTRPDGAVIPFSLGLDVATLPSGEQLTEAIRAVLK